MKYAICIMIIIIVPISAFAQTHQILIPNGASNPGALFYWQYQDGQNAKEITIGIGDIVSWRNIDVSSHNIISGTIQNSDEQGSDFSSDYIVPPGRHFEHQFTKEGRYPFLCTLHPFMTGVVNVVDNQKTLYRIGANDTTDGYTIQYTLDVHLDPNVEINTAQNTISFTLDSQTKGDTLEISLLDQIIENPNAVWVDDIPVEFTARDIQNATLLKIPLNQDSKKIDIMGSHVIPEFGSIALILIVSTSIAAISSRVKWNK